MSIFRQYIISVYYEIHLFSVLFNISYSPESINLKNTHEIIFSTRGQKPILTNSYF